MAHFMVQPLFVWVQDVYRPIFVMGLVGWLSFCSQVTVTYSVCARIIVFGKQQHSFSHISILLSHLG
jgi:hypothetical protein